MRVYFYSVHYQTLITAILASVRVAGMVSEEFVLSYNGQPVLEVPLYYGTLKYINQMYNIFSILNC